MYLVYEASVNIYVVCEAFMDLFSIRGLYEYI